MINSSKILYVGTLEWGSTSLQRMRVLFSLINDLYSLDTRIFLKEYLERTVLDRVKIRLVWPPLARMICKSIQKEARRFRPNIIWIDNGILFTENDLSIIKERFRCKLIHYTADSILSRGMNDSFRRSLKCYDICFTTKEREIKFYKNHGAKRVEFTWQGYDPSLHRPIKLNDKDLGKFSSDVVFVGQSMRDRANILSQIATTINCKLRLFGRGWSKGRQSQILRRFDQGWAYGDDYAKALSGGKIALCFLNREVGDDYTTRTFEIPACGSFMLAERTKTHNTLFMEDVEAVYFDSTKELIDKVRYYLEHEDERRRIAEAGHRRALLSGYSWKDRMAECLEVVNEVV